MRKRAVELSTFHSFGGGVTEIVDPRGSSRTKTVFRIVKVETSQDEGLARLKNLSDGGMMLQLGLELSRDERVTVHLSDKKRLAASVVWTADNGCGLQFPDGIDSAALLTEMAEWAREGSLRPVRLSANAKGVARSERGLCRVRVTDVSQRGMKICHQSAFVEGLPVKIALESGVERRGVVRWSKEDSAGIRLAEAMSLSELGSFKHLWDDDYRL